MPQDLSKLVSSGSCRNEVQDSDSRSHFAHRRVLAALQEAMLQMASSFSAVGITCTFHAFRDVRQLPATAVFEAFSRQIVALAADSSIDPRPLTDLLRTFATVPAAAGTAGIMRILVGSLVQVTGQLTAAGTGKSLAALRDYFIYNPQEAEKILQAHPELVSQLEAAFLRTCSKMQAGHFANAITGLARLTNTRAEHIDYDRVEEAVTAKAESGSFQQSATDRQLRHVLYACGQLELQLSDNARLALQTPSENLLRARTQDDAASLPPTRQLPPILPLPECGIDKDRVRCSLKYTSDSLSYYFNKVIECVSTFALSWSCDECLRYVDTYESFH